VGGTLNVTGSTSLTNPVINNIKMGYTTTATAAGTTTLTVSSNYRQFFTGTSTQTIVLPVTSTLVTGIAYEIENNSTGLLTVNSSGGNLVGTVPAGVCAHAVCIGTTLTTAADWDWDYISTTTITGTGANVLGTSPTITTPTISSLSSAAATALTLQSAGTTAVTIDTSQRVGIGTSSPVAKLQIKQANTSYGILVEASGNDAWMRFQHNDSVGIIETTYDTSAGYTPLTFKTGGAERMRIDSSGNVGIGGSVTNEGGYARALQITGSSDCALQVKTGSSYSYFAQNGTTLQIRNDTTSGIINFSTEATERMRIESGGSVLVGTTSNIAANAKIFAQGNGVGIAVGYGTGSTAYRHMYMNSGDGTLYFFNPTNYASLSAAGAWTNASDARLK
jgi:hypothetical protein